VSRTVVSVEMKGLTKLVDDLTRLRKSALPFAARNALNRSAFAARKEWQDEIKRTFTTRNNFTERSVRVEKATGTDLKSMQSVVGSVAPYMGDQEEGATVRGRGAHKAIPGPVAAGQAAGGKRTRLVRSANKLSAITAVRGKGTTRKQRNAVAMAMAKRDGKPVALLERPGGGKGLFKIGGRKNRITARLLWDVSRSSVRVKAEPTLQRTLKRIHRRVEDIHVGAVIEQLKRHRLLGH
jgi:hypothetical protein